MIAAVRRSPILSLAAINLAVLAVCIGVVRSGAYAANPDVAAWGVTFDLTITVPLLYWLFVVRTGHAGAATLAPVFVVGTVLAAAIVPRSDQEFLRAQLKYVMPLVEVVVLVLLARKLWSLRGADRALPVEERIATAAVRLFGDGPVAKALAFELTMAWFGLFAWRRRHEARDGEFTFHEKTGWATVLACLVVLIVAESVGAHLLISLWSPRAAWIWTAFDAWAVLWLLGDCNALRLRRSFLTSDALAIRFGMRWSLDVPLGSVESVREISSESQWRRKDVLKVAILEDPRWLVTLREPAVARGPVGITRTVRALALRPDDDAVLERLAGRD